MKRKLYLAAFAAVAFASCNEILVNEPENKSGLVTLDLSVPVGETKSEGTEDERKVTNLQVYVFDSQGVLEAYNNVKNATSASIQCTPGTKTAVALVNAPEIKDISKYEELSQKTSDLVENKRYSLVMAGSLPTDVSESSSITVPVTRLASKITLGTITNNMTLDYLKDKNFSIQAVYLINIAGTTGYFEDLEPQKWYNEKKHGNSAYILDLIKRLSSEYINVPYGESYSLNHTFYTYPNGTETDSSDETFGPRYTRLVLEARLDNKLYYYPISIPGLKRNTAYEVNVTITRPGSSSPDIPIDVDDASVNISIQEWIDSEEINEKI
ncbi:MAG: fimbrial protein [Bacteroidales bacterium]|jgi:hypothetical protein|nr:fimbrial protein [Bacteroidales bacterium]